MCKLSLVKSIIDSVSHAILLLYHPQFGSDIQTMPTNNPMESIYSRTMYFLHNVKSLYLLTSGDEKKSSDSKKLLCHWQKQSCLKIENCCVIGQGSNCIILCQLKQPDFYHDGLFINNFV